MDSSNVAMNFQVPMVGGVKRSVRVGESGIWGDRVSGSLKSCIFGIENKNIKIKSADGRAKIGVSYSVLTDSNKEMTFQTPQFPWQKADPKSVASVILGGGSGTHLFPLTSTRAEPAVPIGGCYRLIDILMSNCINSGINKIFILTQLNSASLNRHIACTYNFGNGINFGDGFVEVLAAT